MTPVASLALCIVLLMDGSTSLGTTEWSAAVEAHARGLESPKVIAAIEAAPVAITVSAFAGSPTNLMPWRILRERTDLAVLAADLRDHAEWRTFDTGDGTATGRALRHALKLLDRAPPCDRQIVDIVTDGESNSGPLVTDARDEAAAAGVVVNAVALRTMYADPSGWAQRNLVTPGGFALEATTWEDWIRAIEKKLVMELADARP